MLDLVGLLQASKLLKILYAVWCIDTGKNASCVAGLRTSRSRLFTDWLGSAMTDQLKAMKSECNYVVRGRLDAFTRLYAH